MCDAGRELANSFESVQLLDFSFGLLPLLDLQAELRVGLRQFARSRLDAAGQRLFALAPQPSQFDIGGNLGQQFTRTEWLDQVIIRASEQPFLLRFLPSPCRHQNDWQGTGVWIGAQSRQ